MGCPSCARKKKGEGYTHFEALQHPPFNANDVQVCYQGAARRLDATDWSDDRHKLLLFIPSITAPICHDFDNLGEWVAEFNKLGCDLFLATSEPVHFVDSEPALSESGIKILSSYLLPTRLGVMHNGQSMHASVFITREADVVVQHHFLKVGRSMSELHRMLYSYIKDSQCSEGWQNPSNNFVSETEENDGVEKS